MRIAVTGAAGFVGRHVVAELLARGIEVVAAVRAPNSALPPSPKLTLVHLDIGHPERAFSLLGEPEVLLHLAWGGLPNYQSPSHILDELPRQSAFLESCSRSGLARLVVSGTCLEYGLQGGELDEDLPPKPTTAYGKAKAQLHELLREMETSGGPRLTWTRLFYLYGDGQSPKSLFSQLRAAVKSGASTFPMSPGDQIRDFLPINVAASHLASLALTNSASGTINVCSGSPIQVEALVRGWLRDWNSELRLELGALPYPDYEAREFWGNPQRLNSILEAK